MSAPENPRHPAWVRLTHWINGVCLAVLLMSGLQIFNAHRALYWGIRSDFAHPLLALRRGFPWWITLPGYQDLAAGRHWHFFFAWIFVLNGIVYLVTALIGGHLRGDLLPGGEELSGVGRTLRDHLRLRFPHGATARGYNPLQKLSYLAVIFVLLPLMLLTGLTMSPAVDTMLPLLLTVFGGRQSARTIHFIVASLLVGFTILHIAMVLLSGFVNNMRGMITGHYTIPPEHEGPT